MVVVLFPGMICKNSDSVLWMNVSKMLLAFDTNQPTDGGDYDIDRGYNND